ncbi:MAG: ATP-grasp domain-containing protein, partial [Gammaproteobacteria bacterium]|nr:ATP-grasp domain-containing protein [Gammaproteobacteria bacterium]
MSFDTLLVANRGEIACRILRSARALGLRTVAVYSEADREARHVALADVAVAIGPAPARDSYLSIERLLAACAASGAQAVHPGYGFLSENPAFARACEEAGLVFVGPPADAITRLGNKRAARRLAERVGVPCLVGYDGDDQSAAALSREATRLGAPLMIKAAAGGGGRGMRRVDELSEFDAACETARREAAAACGSGELLLERLVHRARHVEVQVLADRFGHCIHLGERDCSTQRRHQKLVEEAPAPGVTASLRAALGEAAVKLALAAGYVGAGTVEFLLDPEGRFHFLEVNTRLQVEHPVTEAITGLDLVELQLRIARSESLPLRQEDVRFEGHAIEARLCAEDAFDAFRPQAGPILAWRLPEGSPGVRVDHGLAAHAEVSRHYDSMIAKLIAVGR